MSAAAVQATSEIIQAALVQVLQKASRPMDANELRLALNKDHGFDLKKVSDVNPVLYKGPFEIADRQGLKPVWRLKPGAGEVRDEVKQQPTIGAPNIRLWVAPGTPGATAVMEAVVRALVELKVTELSFDQNTEEGRTAAAAAEKAGFVKGAAK